MFRPSRLIRLLLISSTSTLVTYTSAQTDDPYSQKFQWQFRDNAYSASLPTCQPLRILVKSYNADNSTHGTPPYYMLALAVRSTPRLYLIGEEDDELEWTLDYPTGTEMMLTVLDANSSVGGISPRLYTSVPGSSTACVKAPPSSSSSSNEDFTISANVSNTLTTCQPWGITVSGGVPPYRFSLAGLSSTVLTNVSTETEDQDTLTYINRADPDSQLLVTVSDVTGRFASGTPIVNTTGDKNVSCTGLVTTLGNSEEIQRQIESLAQSQLASDRKKRDIAIGVSCGVGGFLLLVAAFFFVRRLKRRKARTDVDFRPRKFELTSPTNVEEMQHTHSGHDRSTSPSTTMGANSSSLSPTRRTFTPPPHPNSNSLQATPIRKPSHQQLNLPQRPSYASLRATATGEGPELPQVEVSSSGELFVQHRDGGVDVVRELPPPYATAGFASRTAGSASRPRGAREPGMKR